MTVRTTAAGGRLRRIPFFTERRREYIAFLFFILPNMGLIALWIYWPFLQSLYLSITSWNPLMAAKKIVWLENYAKLLQSPLFWQVTKNTSIFTAGVVFVQLILALGLAVLLNQKLWALGLWRLAIFSPHVTTAAAMALVWLNIYAPNHGPLAALFGLFDLDFPNVLSSTTLALPALMIVAIWKGLGYTTIVFLAALQGVDRELKDAAAVDGANAWQSFWYVSFPSISPVTYFLVVTGLTGTFQTFGLVHVMTGGGPLNATNLYVFHLYREAFQFYRYGLASALAVLMFILIMVFTYLQTRAAERWVHY